MNKKTALIIGATGLVGSELLNQVLEQDHYHQVFTISRRSVQKANEKLKEHIIDLEQLANYKQLFEVDTVFCSLGTTMKQAKTKEQFLKVDFDYPLEAAKLAKQCNVQQFFIVTAMGANQHSMFFYNQVKGNIEEAIKELKLPSLYIIRPSLLLGKRKKKRVAEDFSQEIARKLPFLFKGPFQKYQPNQAKDVARAMYKLSLEQTQGTFIVESLQIEEKK